MNPQPTVLETVALPVELHPYVDSDVETFFETVRIGYLADVSATSQNGIRTDRRD